uniref:Uncharacterized protein n=1 Tax=Ciona intestinalis TaxID=7719 RepID=H2XMS8_CIOIN
MQSKNIKKTRCIFSDTKSGQTRHKRACRLLQYGVRISQTRKTLCKKMCFVDHVGKTHILSLDKALTIVL